MRMLIVEDDLDIGSFLKKSFEAESFAVDLMRDGESGSFAGRTNEYDVVILDNVLPKKMGIDVCSDIRKSGKQMPIIMLSVRSEIPEKVTMFNAGIDDYVTKPYSFDELLARVHARLRGSKVEQPEILTVGELTLNSETQEATYGKRHIYLTRKEFALLELLMRNKGKVVSRGVIMEHVWDMEGDPLSRTIETHILNLRNKIEANGKTRDMIKNIPGRGYKIDE